MEQYIRTQVASRAAELEGLSEEAEKWAVLTNIFPAQLESLVLRVTSSFDWEAGLAEQWYTRFMQKIEERLPRMRVLAIESQPDVSRRGEDE